MKTLANLLFTLLALTLTLHAQEMNKEDVLDKMIVASGGEEQLHQLDIYEQFWFIQDINNDLNGSEYRMVMMPDYLRSKQRYPDTTEITVLDKQNGTLMINGSIYKTDGPKLQTMKFNMLSLLSPLQLKEKIADIEISENETYYILSLTANSFSIEYYVLKETFLVQKTMATILNDSKEIEMSTVFENYTLFNGVMLPHREIKYINDIKRKVLRLQETRYKKPL